MSVIDWFIEHTWIFWVGSWLVQQGYSLDEAAFWWLVIPMAVFAVAGDAWREAR